MHRFFKRPDKLEARLRAERAQPKKELVERIVARTTGERRRGLPLGARLQLAGALTAIGLAVAVALGGVGDLTQNIGDPNTASHTPGHDQYREQATICHRPPGNPENARTIRVGEPAAERHMEQHGDTPGPCPTGGAAAASAGEGGTASGTTFQETGGGQQPVGGIIVYVDVNGNGILDRDDEGNPTEPFDESDANGAWSIGGLAPGADVRGDDGDNPTCVTPSPCLYEFTGGSDTGLDFVYG